MIDTSVLNQLFEDPVMIKKYLASFRSDIVISLEEMKLNIRKNDWQNAAITAHSLKSNLTYLNETDAVRLVQEIENKCETHEMAESRELHLRVILLEATLDIIREKIDKYLAA
jgi:HPt (histidine-containing phosphotransfer) domain-containing protein